MAVITRRAYHGVSDLPAMTALARACAADHLRVIDLPYRFSSWALDDPANAALWVDDAGRLLGWAVLQTPFWTIDYTCHPQAVADLHPQILAWADERARATRQTPYGLPCWFINVFADLPERRRHLEAAGFADQADVGEDSWSKVFMHRPANLPIKEYPLRQGYTIRPLGGAAEALAYVALHQEAFGSKNMTVEWRLRTLRQPEYTPELDLVVEAPNGTLAAFCIGWLNRQTGAAPAGQIEPLGSHKKHRVHAPGRAVLAEVIRRMQALGVEDIFVETDNYRNDAFKLYEHVGFSVCRDVRVYRKDY